MSAKTLTLRLLGALGLSLVFVAAAGSALIFHLNLPAGRRFLGGVLTRLLDDTFQGTFSVGSIAQAGPSGITGEQIVVRDPSGRTVLKLSKVRAQADVLEILRLIALGGERITLVVDHVHVDRAEARIRQDPKTRLPTLVSAFRLREEPSSTPRQGPPRHVRVAVRSVELTRAFARGRLRDSPTLEAEMGGVRGFVLATPFGAEVGVSRFGLLVRGLAGADTRGVASLHVRAPGAMWTSFDGYVGEVQVGSVLRLDGDHVSASLEIPKARPTDARALWIGYPLLDDASLHLEGSGKLPALALSGRIESGVSALAFDGPVRLWDRAGASLELIGRRLDLSRVLAGAPATDVDLLAALQVRPGADGPALELEASTQPGLIDGVELPAADVRGAVQRGRFTGRALLHEPGLPVRLDFAIQSNGSADLHARATTPRIESVPRLAPILAARGHADLDAKAHIEDGRIAAELEGKIQKFSYGGVTLEQGSIGARAQGPLAAPSELDVDARLSGTELRSGQLSFDRVEARLRGPVLRPRLRASLTNEAGPSLEAETTIAPRPGGVRLDELALRVQREGAELAGKVERIDVAGGKIEVRELTLRGAGGTLTGSARSEPGLFTLNARGQDVDLGALGSLLGLPRSYARGRVNLAADVTLARDMQRGEVSFEFEDGTIGPIDDVSVSGRARLIERRLEASVDVAVEKLGKARAELDGELSGNALEARSFREITGNARLAVNDVDLKLLGHALAPQTEVEALGGKLSLEARLARAEPDAVPDVSLLGFTQGFSLDGGAAPRRAPDGGPAHVPEHWTIEGVDARFGANLRGAAGDTDVSVQLVAPDGILATGSLSTRLDVRRVLADPERALETLRTTPLAAKLLVAERSFDRLPAPLQPPGVSGSVRAEASLSGSAAEPRIAARIELGRFAVSSMRGDHPINVCASVGWDPLSERLISTGEAFLFETGKPHCAGRRVARYAVAGSVHLPSGASALQLEGSGTASLEGLPLDAVPGLAEQGITGSAWGPLSVADIGSAPRMALSLELRRVAIHGVSIGSGKLEARSDDRALGATLGLSQGGGEISATLLAALETRDALPRLDPKQPVGLRVQARHAEAAILSPLTRDIVSDIGGVVDADLTLSLGPADAARAEGASVGTVRGQFTLSDGLVQINGIGVRLHDVELAARAEPRGTGTQISVARLTGRAGRNDERVTVEAGKLWLEGLELVRAEGRLNAIEVPISLEGLSQVTATTRQPLKFALHRTRTQMEVTFDVPYLIVALPQSLGRSVIDLDENRSIEIVQPLGEPRQRGDGLPWLLTFELGDNVKLTRSDLDLPLIGTVQLLLGEATAVGGDIELLPGGRIEVSGKTFVIESGEVHFDSDRPSNPRIRVSASWRAPDGTTIYAIVNGTLQQAEIAFTSEPRLPLPEIYALLLGGGGSGDAVNASAAAGSVGADRLLAPLLANTPLRTVEFRAGSERLGEDRTYTTYSAAVPISDNVWFEGSYKWANSNAADEDNAVSGTIDWRFRRNWSLRTEIGTIGTGVDLVWQYHY